MYLIHLYFILPMRKSETCSGVSFSSLPLSKIHIDISNNEIMQTIIDRMDKQQEATVQHKELYSIAYDKPYEKNMKKDVSMYNWVTLL